MLTNVVFSNLPAPAVPSNPRIKKGTSPLKCGVGEDSRESLGLQGDPTNQSERKSVLTIHWNSELHAEAETPVLWLPHVKS